MSLQRGLESRKMIIPYMERMVCTELIELIARIEHIELIEGIECIERTECLELMERDSVCKLLIKTVRVILLKFRTNQGKLDAWPYGHGHGHGHGHSHGHGILVLAAIK